MALETSLKRPSLQLQSTIAAVPRLLYSRLRRGTRPNLHAFYEDIVGAQQVGLMKPVYLENEVASLENRIDV